MVRHALALVVVVVVVLVASVSVAQSSSCPAVPIYNPMTVANVSECSGLASAYSSFCSCLGVPNTLNCWSALNSSVRLSCPGAATCLRNYFGSLDGDPTCVRTFSQVRAGRMLAALSDDRSLQQSCAYSVCTLAASSPYLHQCGLDSALGIDTVCNQEQTIAYLSDRRFSYSQYAVEFTAPSAKDATDQVTLRNITSLAALIAAVQQDATATTGGQIAVMNTTALNTTNSVLTVILLSSALNTSKMRSLNSSTFARFSAAYQLALQSSSGPLVYRGISLFTGPPTNWSTPFFAAVSATPKGATALTSPYVMLGFDVPYRQVHNPCFAFTTNESLTWPQCASSATSCTRDMVTALQWAYQALSNDMTDGLQSSLLYVDLLSVTMSGRFNGTPAQQRCLGDLYLYIRSVPALLQCDFGGDLAPYVCNPLRLANPDYVSVWTNTDTDFIAQIRFDNLGAVDMPAAIAPTRVASGISALITMLSPMETATPNITTDFGIQITSYSFTNIGSKLDHSLTVAFAVTTPSNGDVAGTFYRLLNNASFVVPLLKALPWINNSSPPPASSVTVTLTAILQYPTTTTAPGAGGYVLSWSCFDYPIAYWSVLEGAYLEPLLGVCLYVLFLLLVLSRVLSTRDVTSFKESLTIAHLVALSVYLLLYFNQIIEATGYINGVAMCTFPAPSDPLTPDPLPLQCRKGTHDFSPVSVAAAWVTWWGSFMLLPALVLIGRVATPSGTHATFRATRVLALLACDVYPLLIAPGYVAVDTRPLYGDCITSRVALYDFEISLVFFIVSFALLASVIWDLRVGASAEWSVSSLVLSVALVFGIGVSLVHMSFLRAAGWNTYAATTLLPVLMAVLHHVLYGIFARRPLWAQDPLSCLAPYAIDLLEDEVKAPVLSLNAIRADRSGEVLLDHGDSGDSRVDPTSAGALWSHVHTASVREELRVYSGVALAFTAFNATDQTLAHHRCLSGVFNFVAASDLGMTPAESLCLAFFLLNEHFEQGIAALLGGTRFEGATAPWFDYHLYGPSGRSSSAVILSVLLRAVEKLPRRKCGRCAGLRAIQASDAVMNACSTPNQRFSWSRLVRVTTANLLPSVRNMEFFVPSEACRDASLLFVDTPEPVWIVPADTAFVVSRVQKTSVGGAAITKVHLRL